ncbi:hypothetical protein GQR58_017330 [Nymphon striatum]|nr:hypothetical protein GQR58_017330 [Nymphon striatum]
MPKNKYEGKSLNDLRSHVSERPDKLVEPEPEVRRRVGKLLVASLLEAEAHSPPPWDVFLAKPKKVKKDVDYELCIICQIYERKTKLNKLQKETADKLKTALDARNDKIDDRLKDDVANELWIEEKVPKWHKKCRSWYINKQNYTFLALKKQGKSLDAVKEEEPGTSRSPRCATHSIVPAFFSKKQCVICSKEYYKSRKLTLKVTTKKREAAITEKAKSLKQDKLLRRIERVGHDMVANDICYHKECMDRFMSIKPKKGKSVEEVVYDKVFLKFTNELEGPLFNEQKGFLISQM